MRPPRARRAAEEGLRSEALREGLSAALAGKPERLEDLLCRYGGGADPRPNLRLAAAFGAEIGARGAAAERLLARLAADDADPETPRVFLTIAAAFGWASWLGTPALAGRAWTALGELAADERAPVRVATVEALRAFAVGSGGALALVTAAEGWLSLDDLDARFTAAAVAIEVLRDRRFVSALAARAELPRYLDRVVAEVAGAPRSSQRLDGRRRLLQALPPTLTLVVGAAGARAPAAPSTPSMPSTPSTIDWFEQICATADDPDVRAVLSSAILGLQAEAVGASPVLVERLRELMVASAKPLRDPTRLRPGVGRGKASRAMR